MSMDMVERVARALLNEDLKRDMPLDAAERADWVNRLWRGKVPDARAAIEAMREPETHILQAMCEVRCNSPVCMENDGCSENGHVEKLQEWQRCIDTILEGGE